MKKLIFRGPVMTASGYGVHARMLLKALIESGNFDITVMSVPWGATPLLHEKTPFLDEVRKLSAKFNPQSPGDFDVSVQVTIPNEFEKFAPVNIGVTAGIESDKVSHEWISKCNEKIDLLIVPSKHSADAFAATGGLDVPVVIVPEWVDTAIFNTKPVSEEQVNFGCNFNFLAVGLGLDKAEGEDRKNFGQLIRWFCEQFRGRKDVGLVLKLSIVNYSEVDFSRVKDHILQIKRRAGVGEFPRITLIHGRYSDEEFAKLYKHPQIKALVTLTHGEGYGLPIIEAAACGLPVIATNWSGHLDFLQINGLNRFVPVDYVLKEIPQSAVWKHVMEEGTKWAYPLENDAKLKMAKVVMSYARPKQWAEELAVHIADEYSPKLGESFAHYVETAVSQGIVAPVKAGTEEQQMISDLVKSKRKEYGIEDCKSLIYTMPQSAGDVFISTGVVSALRKKYPDHKIVFAVNPQFNDILKGNPSIDLVVQFGTWMYNTRILEFTFDEVFTPNIPVQNAGANWVGKGRKLGEVFAHHCGVELMDPQIKLESVDGLPDEYIVFHPGAGSDKWSARGYKHWQNVVNGLCEKHPDLPVVQVGTLDEPLYEGVVDFRGKTNYNQLANVVREARAQVGIDSFPMHLAGAFCVPSINLFGSSTPSATSPVQMSLDSVMIETPDRFTCKKPCYLDKCIVDSRNPCINNITPQSVLDATLKVLGG